MMDQILMQFCDQKHNAWPYIVKQDHTGQDKDQQELIRKWDSERELVNDDIAHT